MAKKRKELIAALAEVFESAGKAHHEAFKSADGADPEWPLWYAEHVHEELQRVLGARVTKSRIVYFILLAEKKRAKKAPDADWPTYYAKVFAKRLG